MVRFGESVTNTLSIVEIVQYMELTSSSSSSEPGSVSIGFEWHPFTNTQPATGRPFPYHDWEALSVVVDVGAAGRSDTTRTTTTTSYSAVGHAALEWLPFRGPDYGLGVGLGEAIARPDSEFLRYEALLVVLRAGP